MRSRGVRKDASYKTKQALRQLRLELDEGFDFTVHVYENTDFVAIFAQGKKADDLIRTLDRAGFLSAEEVARARQKN